MHQFGAGLLANAPSWCSGVLFLYHTTNKGFQCFGPGEAHAKLKLHAFLPNFFIFCVKTDYLYSNKTGCKKYIAAHHFCSKFLFYKEKR
jgi:hypothetical protein